eukprot:6199836-Prymnesium_polylepis.1
MPRAAVGKRRRAANLIFSTDRRAAKRANASWRFQQAASACPKRAPPCEEHVATHSSASSCSARTPYCRAFKALCPFSLRSCWAREFG